MRLHLVLLALALGCATEDSKTDDTSSNGSGENGSGDDGDGGLASLISDVAEMSAKIAAQQATIAQLEMQMSQTLRWETFEHTCAADDYKESTGVTADGAVTATAYGVYSWGFYLSDSSPDFRDGEVTIDCYGVDAVYAVKVGYER